MAQDGPLQQVLAKEVSFHKEEGILSVVRRRQRKREGIFCVVLERCLHACGREQILTLQRKP
jgi:hypothetical protein